MNQSEFKEIASSFEVREYSGRGMFGRKCVGIECESPNDVLLELCQVIAAEYDQTEVYELIESLKKHSIDSMGMGYILYFPNIECE